MTEQELREMKLNEVITLADKKSIVLRVIGGWIYNLVIVKDGFFGGKDYSVNSVFVPEQITVNNTY